MMDLSNIPSNTSYPYIHYLVIQQLRQGDRKQAEILGRTGQKRSLICSEGTRTTKANLKCVLIKKPHSCFIDPEIERGALMAPATTTTTISSLKNHLIGYCLFAFNKNRHIAEKYQNQKCVLGENSVRYVVFDRHVAYFCVRHN